MRRAVCKGCGRPIIWATNPATGKRVPIDPTPVSYHVYETKGGEIECIPVDCPDGDVIGVNHFSTCPSANGFNKRSGSSNA